MSAIAIVGMACRFADAPNLQRYWDLIRQGRDAFGPVPADRWDHEAFMSKTARDMDRTQSPNGAFMKDVKTFPALAFGIPPRRVEVMDPQQRFALETAFEAMEDAGYAPDQMPHKTGVFMGVTDGEYRALMQSRTMALLMSTGALGVAPEDPTAIAEAVENVVPTRPFSSPGALGNMIAAAVAQEFNLHGPAYTTDAACSSAMVAIQNAVIQLRTGQVDAALAGGAYIQLTPDHYVAFTRIGAMSKQGRCLPFDERADGFVQGDGVGLVMLKRLEDAQRDGDRIYAVLHGIAVNNDGRGDGPMAPLASGQSEVIRQAWKDAGQDSTEATHIEAHGTGTLVGDVTEVSALYDALGQPKTQLALGSSKANVGHTMSAAGMAGLVKTALSIYHKTIPPLAGFESGKADLQLEERKYVIPTEPTPWTDPKRLAGVSSFGFGGTNGHAVLGAGPEIEAQPEQHELILLSAPDEAKLRDLAGQIADTLDVDATISLRNVARAWAHRRPQDFRAAVVAGSLQQLREQLRTLEQGGHPEGVQMGGHEGTPKLAFLFPGQGSQRIGMMRQLVERFPVVRDTLNELEGQLGDLLPVPLTHLLYPELRQVPVDDEAAMAELTATENCQPVLLACGVALARLLGQVGVTPEVVLGHSLGEFTAAAVAGVLPAAQAATFVGRRGQKMAELPGDHGAMCAVMAERSVVESLLVDGAIIANVNHPRQFVVSGATEAIEQVVAAAEAREIKATRLVVSHGFHSPVLGDMDVSDLLADIDFADPKVAVASAISSAPYADADDAKAVFGRHAVSPVLFTDALKVATERGADLFLQVGAGGPLASFARGTLPSLDVASKGVFTLASREDDEGVTSLLATLGQLWIAGVELDLMPLLQGTKPASVPPTVLPREEYWAIKDKRTRPVKISGVKHRPRPQVIEMPAVAKEEAAAPVAAAPADDTMGQVLKVIAKVSAYPEAALKPQTRLMEDLGFDSLMVGDLSTGLAEAFPGMGGIPQELFINSPTVQTIVDFVAGGASTSGEAASDDADDQPLTAYAPVWSPTPLAELPGREIPADNVVVHGGHAEDVAAVVASLQEQGLDARAATSTTEPADVIVWVGPFGAAAAPEAGQWPDQAGELLALLDAQAARDAAPHVVALSKASDVWAAGVAGALRGVSREWPDAMVKHIRAGSLAEAAGVVVDELTAADRTVDVRYVMGLRHVRALRAVSDESVTALPETAVVAISGGTRGIGLKLAERLAGKVAGVYVIGRKQPTGDEKAILDGLQNVHVVLADVTDSAALTEGLKGKGITHVFHGAGILADGPLGKVDAQLGHKARSIKVDGWLNLIEATRGTLQAIVGIGSWAGRFGNRHQAHYGAANNLLSALSRVVPEGVHGAVAEYGPWAGTAMVDTIPAPVRAAMRKEGVDFVGMQVGLDALLAATSGKGGPLAQGRRVPHTTREAVTSFMVSTETDPYLLDHAIDGTPVLPLAGATDLMAWAADLPAPFEVRDVKLFKGIAVREPTLITVKVSGDKAAIHLGEEQALAYTATVVPVQDSSGIPARPTGGKAPSLSLREFYDDITFHGPLLQGLTAIEAVGEDFATGTIVGGHPAKWTPATSRSRFSVDPLALDSAFQLAAHVAWTRYERAGTPVSLGRVRMFAPLVAGRSYDTAVHFGEASEDRFSATVVVRDATGALVMVAEDVVAELRKVTRPGTSSDVSKWPEVTAMADRLEGVKAMGLRNPYFAVHEGTARDTTSVDGRELINFSSYNYLGLSGDPRVLKDVKEAVERYGTSVSASRVASGERPFHGELEKMLAEAQGCEDALLFTAGHATNVTTVGHLMGPDDLILHDEYIHDSILQGIKLSGAQRRGFRHEDPTHLEEQLKALRPHYRRCLIVVEGVYSMDGDICQLPEYIRLKKQHDCLLMVDEAHSFGIVGKTGRGVAEHFGIQNGDVDIFMGTLSKSVASCGGWIAGSKALIQYLKYTAPGFVYSAGLTAANGVAALSALKLMLQEPERVEKLQANAMFFHDELEKRGMDTGPALGGSAVIPLITGNSAHALVLSEKLQDQGINVQPIVYPAVAEDAARLRFFLSSTHSFEQLALTAETASQTLAAIREAMPAAK